jgi:hypothetical protein
MNNTNVYFTDNYEYNCQYCGKDFVPNRRKVQKYCSNSCRSKAYHQRTKIAPLNAPTVAEIQSSPEKKEKVKIEKVSSAGIANAAIGVTAVNLISNIFTKEDDKPATKGDLKRLSAKLGNFHPIANLEPGPDGRKPYFNVETKRVVYL